METTTKSGQEEITAALRAEQDKMEAVIKSIGLS
jgi:hypothetical protein